MTEAINPDRRAEKVVMNMLGLKSKKAFRKWERRKRRERRKRDE